MKPVAWNKSKGYAVAMSDIRHDSSVLGQYHPQDSDTNHSKCKAEILDDAVLGKFKLKLFGTGWGGGIEAMAAGLIFSQGGGSDWEQYLEGVPRGGSPIRKAKYSLVGWDIYLASEKFPGRGSKPIQVFTDYLIWVENSVYDAAIDKTTVKKFKTSWRWIQQ